jgi:uncharacterized membrane protein YraQ (UPF0718 family)
MIFVLVTFSIFVAYIIYKFGFLDAIWGILLAILIGGTIFYFRINKVRLFSSNDYIDADMKWRKE